MYKNISCLTIQVGETIGSKDSIATPLQADIKFTCHFDFELYGSKLDNWKAYAKLAIDKMYRDPLVVSHIGEFTDEIIGKGRDELGGTRAGGVRGFLEQGFPYIEKEGYNFDLNNEAESHKYDKKVTFEFYSEVEPTYVPIQEDNVGNNPIHPDRARIYKVLWHSKNKGISEGILYNKLVKNNADLYEGESDSFVFGSYFTEGDLWVV